MSATARQWQARFVISSTTVDYMRRLQTVCLYGRSINELRLAVSTYLREKKPVFFSNRGDHITGQMKYAHSDGKTISLFFSEKNNQGLPEGWWYKQEVASSSHLFKYASDPQPIQRLRSFDAAIDHFVTYALILERGPDYRSKAVVGGDFRLPFLEKVLREAKEHQVNDLIERGWHIIALEYKGELSMSGELMNRETIFVLGHPDARAAMIPLDSESLE